jgi:lysophospholipase L1-like esterase
MMMSVRYSFLFQDEKASPEDIRIEWGEPYEMGRGFGFAIAPEPSKNEDLRDSWPGDYVVPAVPTFLIDVPYGNYKISVSLGSHQDQAQTTVIAGLGQRILEQLHTEAGQFVTRTFAVHVEDGQLKLAFGGEAPRVRSVEIVRDASIATIFLAGDSTVTNQPSGQYPYTGWGQTISLFLNERAAISNEARSGRSSKSFIDEFRLNRVWKKLRPSDFLFIQFAHNDEKDNEGGTDPLTTYPQYLKQYIQGARERGAHPVLIAPMHRRFFDEQGAIQNTHGDYIEAMRRLAEEEQVPYLDLAGKSKQLFERVGVEESKKLFMWIEPNRYWGLPNGTEDNTHFSVEGGTEIARLVAECIRESGESLLIALLK